MVKRNGGDDGARIRVALYRLVSTGSNLLNYLDHQDPAVHLISAFRAVMFARCLHGQAARAQSAADRAPLAVAASRCSRLSSPIPDRAGRLRLRCTPIAAKGHFPISPLIVPIPS